MVCCRVSPKQKAKLIKLIKKYSSYLTLSIGDGDNDFPMLMESHIGVVINGKEGDQAARSADYSIGKFRFLEKLLLIYGRNGYVKISKIICYYFYKNIIMVFSSFFFTCLNGFSSQIFFVYTLSWMYNAIFNSWPFIFTFSLEKDLDLSVVKSFHILYEAGRMNYYFNSRVLWFYIIIGIIHETIAWFIPSYGYVYNDNNEGSSELIKSSLSFCIIIHIVTYKLLVMSEYFTIIHISTNLIAILFYYFFLAILSLQSLSLELHSELQGVFFNLIKNRIFWLIIICSPPLDLIIDISLYQIATKVNRNL